MRRLAAAFLLALAAACSEPPKLPRPPPPIALAPPELRVLRIHVQQIVTPAETPEDADDYQHQGGGTGYLRNAFQVALARAGYVVVLQRHDVYDLEARIVGAWNGPTGGVATMTLRVGGKVIGQLSAPVPKDLSKEWGDFFYDDGAAVLVEKMSAAPAVAAFAREVAARTTKVAAPN